MRLERQQWLLNYVSLTVVQKIAGSNFVSPVEIAAIDQAMKSGDSESGEAGPAKEAEAQAPPPRFVTVTAQPQISIVTRIINTPTPQVSFAPHTVSPASFAATAKTNTASQWSKAKRVVASSATLQAPVATPLADEGKGPHHRRYDEVPGQYPNPSISLYSSPLIQKLIQELQIGDGDRVDAKEENEALQTARVVRLRRGRARLMDYHRTKSMVLDPVPVA